MKNWHIFLIALLTVALGYPIIVILTSLFSTYTGDAPVTATIYNAGVTGIILSILILCAVIITCTLLILRVLKIQK